MNLLPAELRASIPLLYSQENVPLQDRIVYAKFFFPAGNWTWFVTEGEDDEDDFRMFGYVVGFAEEWGYFSLNELKDVSVIGLNIERDLYFEPGPFSEVISRFRKEHGE
jgi:hypothetical protein